MQNASGESEDRVSTHPPPMWAREEAQQISEQDAENLFESAKNPSETVLRIRREAKRMEVRERKGESQGDDDV